MLYRGMCILWPSRWSIVRRVPAIKALVKNGALSYTLVEKFLTDQRVNDGNGERMKDNLLNLKQQRRKNFCPKESRRRSGN